MLRLCRIDVAAIGDGRRHIAGSVHLVEVHLEVEDGEPMLLRIAPEIDHRHVVGCLPSVGDRDPLGGRLLLLGQLEHDLVDRRLIERGRPVQRMRSRFVPRSPGQAFHDQIGGEGLARGALDGRREGLALED